MPKKKDATAVIDSDRIAQRAYELYQSRGEEHGADLDDWLAAEQELRPNSKTETPAPPARRASSRTKKTE